MNSNPYQIHNVIRLWNGGKIIHMAYTMGQMIQDSKRMKLKGTFEEKQMPLYLIEIMSKNIAKERLKNKLKDLPEMLVS